MTGMAMAGAQGGNVSTRRDIGLTVGLVLLQVIIGLALSRYGVRFDGFLDVHRPSATAVPLGVALYDQAAMIVAIAIGIVIVSPWRSRARASDVALVVSLARLPVLLWAPAVLFLPLPDALLAMTPSDFLAPSPLIVAAGLGATVSFVAAVALLANGLRRLTDVRAWKLAGLTVLVVLMAESGSKLVLAAEKIARPSVVSS
jgi:hypothetical protein